MKVLLILSDGMRPDALGDNATIKFLKENGTYCMNARTVMPSVTLPCHMSLFHSVDPARHGITTNTYTPQVRPISGLFEQLKKKSKKCAMFYNWEELRDLGRPDSLARSVYTSGHVYGYEAACKESFENAKETLKNADIDFTFLYFGLPDHAGHHYYWMSEEYFRAVNVCCDWVGKLIEELGDEYTIVYTADHGGHDGYHGTEMPEDMTIPVFFYGKPFEAGKELNEVSIKDIAPTIASLLDAEIPEEWEGRILK